ncbi:hypothetical protein ACC691_38565, partial [Rhizobium johnstonii]|uniref:hypothetical protein n=1 Tax=Rhizobium johnstonii TaxID=3019933 RepID=UPI003F9A3542
LYTLGWAIVATRVGTDATDAVGRIMFTVGNWLAVLATPLWFVVTLALTSERPRARVLWLVGGAVLLVPLPFILATGAAV